MTSGKPTWCNGSTLGRNTRDVGFQSRSRHSIFHFHHTHDTLNDNLCMTDRLTVDLYMVSILVKYIYGSCTDMVSILVDTPTEHLCAIDILAVDMDISIDYMCIVVIPKDHRLMVDIPILDLYM